MNSITINGKTITCSGNSIIVSVNKVVVDGNIISEGLIGDIIVSIVGDINKIECAGSVEVTGNVKETDCGGSCEVNGDVRGNIDCGGSCQCGNVLGDIDAGGSVKYMLDRISVLFVIKEGIKIELITKGRGQGKTYDLIMESAKTGFPIVTPYDSRYIVEQARYMGVKIHQPMSLKEFRYFMNNGSLKNNSEWKGKVIVDEVDSLLREVLGVNVDKVTLTPDSMNTSKILMEKTVQRVNLWKQSAYSTTISKQLKEAEKQMTERDRIDKYDLLINSASLHCASLQRHGERVTDVSVIVPNQVVEVTFADRTKQKSVCKEPDVFSLEQAISICITKKIMGGSGRYNNAIKAGLKVYEGKLKKKDADQAEQDRIEKKHAKKLAYFERRKKKIAEAMAERLRAEREEMIEIQKEAYVRAIEIVNGGSRE